MWRLRRARTAETGEMALSVDGGHWKRENVNHLSRLLTRLPEAMSECLVLDLLQSVAGCRYLIYCLKKVRQSVEQHRELTEAAITRFNNGLRRQADDLGDYLDQLHADLLANPGKLEPEALRIQHQQKALKHLDDQIHEHEFWMERRKQRESAEEHARQAAAVLPAEATLEKILRYETALERQLYRAMNQLERLQRRRSRETIPAPLTVDISAKA